MLESPHVLTPASFALAQLASTRQPTNRPVHGGTLHLMPSITGQQVAAQFEVPARHRKAQQILDNRLVIIHARFPINRRQVSAFSECSADMLTRTLVSSAAPWMASRNRVLDGKMVPASRYGWTRASAQPQRNASAAAG